MGARQLRLVMLAGAVTSTLPRALQGQVPTELAGFDRYVEQTMSDWVIQGLAVSVVKDDRIVLARGYGTRTLGRAEAVDAETVFAIGSATKSFTTAALGILVDEGALDLDDPVVEHLPWFRLWDPWVTAHITVRDLVTHRSGLPGGRANLLWYGSSYDRHEIVRRLRYLEPTVGFRAEYQYQNLMFLAAGLVVEAASGMTWDEFVRERILTPLGMERTSTSTTVLADQDNVATPHVFIQGRWQTVPWRNVDNVGPAGSINATAADMAQWVRLHLGEGQVGDQRILSEAMAREMGTPQFIVEPGGSMGALDRANAGIDFFTYGLGWQVFEYQGRKVMWHGGNIDGMAALVAMIPQEELGLVILTNRNGGTARDALMMRVFDAYLGVEPRDWSRDLLAIEGGSDQESYAPEAHEVDPDPAPGRSLEAFEGVYEDRLLGEARVMAADGALRVRLETGLELELRPRPGVPGAFRLQLDDRGLLATFGSLQGGSAIFTWGSGGEPETLEMDGIGVFRRTGASVN